MPREIEYTAIQLPPQTPAARLYELRHEHLTPGDERRLEARIINTLKGRVGAARAPESCCARCGGQPFCVIGGRVLCAACIDQGVV
jgi:hypothetical protein